MHKTFWKTELTDNRKNPTYKKDMSKKLKKSDKVYYIPKISSKKQKRLQEEGSEKELFKMIAETRAVDNRVIAKHLDRKDGEIIECFKTILLEDLRHDNFSHIKPKGTHPELRLDPNNIEIVSRRWHFYHHNKLYIPKDFIN